MGGVIQRRFTDALLPLRTRNLTLPIVFLEFGYVDVIESPYQSYFGEFTTSIYSDDNGNALDDGQETQANVYQAFFNVNEQNGDLVSGTFLWGHDWGSDAEWAGSFGLLRGFAIRDNLAEDVVAAEYASHLVFSDGFESGDTLQWSGGVP